MDAFTRTSGLLAGALTGRGLLRVGHAQRALALQLLAMSFAAGPALAAEPQAGSASTGRASAATAQCAQCHGAQGEGQPATGMPKLAGLGTHYLIKQLQDFRTGKRSNPIMGPIATALDERTINEVSTFYGGLGVGQTPTVIAPRDEVRDVGARLAHTGKWEANVPACFACHGPGGLGVAPHFPAIIAQNRAYTAKQLRDWKAGRRLNDPLGLMKAVADKMSDAEIDAVSAYLERAAVPVAKR